MGCDIHTSVQIRRDGVWVDAQGWEQPHGYYQVVGGELLNDRNYALFSILAGVRGEVDKPLAKQRGMPAGVSKETLDFHDSNHSKTYFTLAEVLAYDWTQTFTREGWLEPKEYARFKVNGRPSSWCGSISGGSVVHLENGKMEEIIIKADKGRGEGKKAFPFHDLLYANSEDGRDALNSIWILAHGHPYTHVTWTLPYYDVVGELFASAVPRALKMGAPEDVRFIVSFDS